MTRSVEDTMLVWATDDDDSYSIACDIDYDAHATIKGLRVGYFPDWMREATEVERRAGAAKNLGPDWPYDALDLNLLEVI